MESRKTAVATHGARREAGGPTCMRGVVDRGAGRGWRGLARADTPPQGAVGRVLGSEEVGLWAWPHVVAGWITRTAHLERDLARALGTPRLTCRCKKDSIRQLRGGASARRVMMQVRSTFSKRELAGAGQCLELTLLGSRDTGRAIAITFYCFPCWPWTLACLEKRAGHDRPSLGNVVRPHCLSWRMSLADIGLAVGTCACLNPRAGVLVSNR